MNSVYFTIKDRKSLKTLRLEYGQLGLKFMLRLYEGEINGHGETERLPIKEIYKGQQELLKRVRDLKKELLSHEWTSKDSPTVSQTSFLRSDEQDGQVGLKFEK